MPPVWWWLLVMSVIILFIYLWKKVLDDMEKEYVPLSLEERLQQRIMQLKFFEVVAWILMPIGFIIYIYGIANSSQFAVFLIASCLIVVGYFAASYYKKQRLRYKKELEEK